MSIFFGKFWLYVIIFLLGISLGWSVSYQILKKRPISGALIPLPLREQNNKYTLINPLLTCNVEERKEIEEESFLRNKIVAFIKERTRQKDIDAASVYFRDLNSGLWININNEERFIPASLGKVPIMTAYLKIAETKPEILDKKILYGGGDNLNFQQEIKPKEGIVANRMYSITELLEKMITYSDNNATQLLYNNLNKNYLREIYSDLGIPFNDTDDVRSDILTTHSYALFYRILYNATYLSRPLSEKALELLTQTNFKEGLVAGIPEGITIAHKFGLGSFNNEDDIIRKRELHDCGIIYYPQHPYLLCIMTKSKADISKVSAVIRDISKLIYQDMHAKYN